MRAGVGPGRSAGYQKLVHQPLFINRVLGEMRGIRPLLEGPKPPPSSKTGWLIDMRST